MGGTGGPGGSRAQAQQGLQGAGLLSGASPNATTTALGVEGAAQPAVASLSGASPGPISASNTPTSAVVDTPTLPMPPPGAASAPTSPFQLAPISNLGLPTAAMPLGAVGHIPFGGQQQTGDTLAARETGPTLTGTDTSAAADPNAPSPSDWLYPGNLPMDFDPRQGEFGMPRPYASTGAFYTPGYGAAGNFGGVAGYGPTQQGLRDQVLLPEMAAGTKLEGADIDQRNRVSRADYDRYMKLYGVGYHLPAYRNALNGLVYEQNMRNYTPGGGG